MKRNHLEADNADALPSFDDVTTALRRYHKQLGGSPHYKGKDPFIKGKFTRAKWAEHSDYEYVFLQILAFAAISSNVDEIVRINNGAFWRRNPATMRVEQLAGITMHGDRPGANGIVKAAPDVLLRAFALGRSLGELERFFREAFDRTADPCLEGRVGRLLTFLERHAEQEGASGEPPAGDLMAEALPKGSKAEHVVGEHLRVFSNRVVWDWARASGLTYARAKALWEHAENGLTGAEVPEAKRPRLSRSASGSLLPDVAAACNERTFFEYLVKSGAISGEAAEGLPELACAIPRSDAEAAAIVLVQLGTLHPAQ